MHKTKNTSLCLLGITVPVGPQEKVCKAIVVCFTADLPAKAKVLHFNQYNGEYGCNTCVHAGKTVPVGRGITRAFEYRATPEPLRDHNRCFELGRQALQIKHVCTYCIYFYGHLTCDWIL